ncbi:hypothetical protein [Streptomyces harbinensis]
MANPNKAKGTAWESNVRDFLNRELGLTNDGGAFLDPYSGLNVRRAAQEGAADVGDIHAVPFILEAKNVAGSAVPTWLRQAEREAVNAGFPYGVAVVKARRAPIGNGLVHFGVRTWTSVRLELGMTSQGMAERYEFTPSIRGIDSSRWYLTTTLDRFSALLADIREVHARGENDEVR